jgi:hypothetical protein
MKSTAYIEKESALQGRHSVEQLPGSLPTLRTLQLLRIHQANY